MTRSLSVLLPVHNIQRTLWASVHEILDIMSELTSRFELIVIDEGSTDGTWDVARELARHYPQVRLLRDDAVESVRGATRSSARRSHVGSAQGDVVMVHDGRTPIDAREIARLWRSPSAATPAPKFLSTPGSSSAARAVASSHGRVGCGFRLLRPPVAEDSRRLVSASGVR